MRKLQVCGLLLVAVFALNAIVVSSASAEETLLAEWLISGAGVTGTVNWVDPGEYRVGAKSVEKVQCSLIERGTLKADGEDNFTEILTSGEVLVTSTAPALCKPSVGCEENATDIEAYPLNLPWKARAFLDIGGGLLELVENETWHISCLILGVKAAIECKSTDAEFELLNVAGGVEVMGVGQPFGTCPSGEKAFESEQIAGSGDESTVGALTVSSE